MDNQKITSNLVEMYSRDNFLMRMNLRFFLRLSGLNHVKRESKILDCGCALGHLIAMLQSAGFRHLVGIDAAKEMVEGARALTGVKAIHADVRELEQHIAPGEFDVIIVSGLIHHLTTVSDWERFLVDCRRGLKEDGLLVMREPLPTLLVRILQWMSRYKVFYFGVLKAQCTSLTEEGALVDYFFKFWVGSHKELLAKHGFAIKRDLSWLVHRITVCRKTRLPAGLN